MATTRRTFLGMPAAALAAGERRARIAITFDLEMSRNFPRWDDTHWDYEKGNLDADTKKYAVAVARRVKENGGRVHFFVVGRALEQEDAGWLEEIVREGHPAGVTGADVVETAAWVGVASVVLNLDEFITRE